MSLKPRISKGTRDFNSQEIADREYVMRAELYDHLTKGKIVYYYVYVRVSYLYYVYLLADYFEVTSMQLAIVRAFSAVPAHASFGIVMGYFFMKYAYVNNKENLFFYAHY